MQPHVWLNLRAHYQVCWIPCSTSCDAKITQAKMTWGNSQIGDLTDCHCTWHWCEGYRQNMQAILVFQAYIGDWSLVVRFLVGSVAFLLGSDAIFEIDPPQFGSYLPLLLLAPKSWSCVGPAVFLGKKEGNSKVLFPSTSSACLVDQPRYLLVGWLRCPIDVTKSVADERVLLQKATVQKNFVGLLVNCSLDFKNKRDEPWHYQHNNVACTNITLPIIWEQLLS